MFAFLSNAAEVLTLPTLDVMVFEMLIFHLPGVFNLRHTLYDRHSYHIWDGGSGGLLTFPGDFWTFYEFCLVLGEFFASHLEFSSI